LGSNSNPNKKTQVALGFLFFLIDFSDS